MKKSNIIFFVIIILVIIAIFGYAIWSDNNQINQGESDTNILANSKPSNELDDNSLVGNEVLANETSENGVQSESNTLDSNTISSSTNDARTNYEGKWYVSEEAYRNAERIDEILERREENVITEEEFEQEMSSELNSSIAELDVDEYNSRRIEFDFELTSPAPTQREAKLDNISVELTDGVGTFTYRDNWGTSGNGTITLKDNTIQLRLETTRAAQGAMWGVEGNYTFSYRIGN